MITAQRIAQSSQMSQGSLFATVFLFCSLASGGIAQAREKLTIGYWSIPPHVVGVVDKRPKGAAVSYFEKYISPHFGISFVWDENVTPPTRLMDQLRKGQKDAMIFLGYTKERAEYLRYPKPYLRIPQTFAFLHDHPIDRVQNVSDLYGLRVGFLAGGRIPDKLRDDKIQYDLIAGEKLFERNIEKLLLGRIDAVYVPLTIAMSNLLKEMEMEDKVKLVQIEFLDPVLIYTVFSRTTVSQAIVEKYNKALEAANNEKKYEVHVKSYQSE